MIVYESGIFAVSTGGQVIWHRKKAWDDILVNADNNRLIFMMEEGKKYAVDAHTGDLILQST
jgi:hypothetical protein